jgi:hypothetical protein
VCQIYRMECSDYVRSHYVNYIDMEDINIMGDHVYLYGR